MALPPPPPITESLWDEAHTIITSATQQLAPSENPDDTHAAIQALTPHVARALAERDRLITTLRAQVLRLQTPQEETR